MISKSLLVVVALTLTLAVATAATATTSAAEARPAPTATMSVKKKCKSWPPGCVLYFNKRETKAIDNISIGGIIAIITVAGRGHPVVLIGAGFAAPALAELASETRRKGYCLKASFSMTSKPKVGRYKGRSKGCR